MGKPSPHTMSGLEEKIEYFYDSIQNGGKRKADRIADISKLLKYGTGAGALLLGGIELDKIVTDFDPYWITATRDYALTLALASLSVHFHASEKLSRYAAKKLQGYEFSEQDIGEIAKLEKIGKYGHHLAAGSFTIGITALYWILAPVVLPIFGFLMYKISHENYGALYKAHVKFLIGGKPE